MINPSFIQSLTQSKTIHKGQDSINRILQLGVPLESLKSAVIMGFEADKNKSIYSARTHGGMSKWGHTIIGLREYLIPLGWSMSEKYNLSRTISPNNDLAVIVSSGNAGVSNENYDPTTLNKKGELSFAVVEGNNVVQLNLFPLTASIPKKKKYDIERMLHWFLLYYTDGINLWFELSLPRELNKEGRISSWFERIIFPPIEIASLNLKSFNDEQPEDVNFEIPKKY